MTRVRRRRSRVNCGYYSIHWQLCAANVENVKRERSGMAFDAGARRHIIVNITNVKENRQQLEKVKGICHMKVRMPCSKTMDLYCVRVQVLVLVLAYCHEYPR